MVSVEAAFALAAIAVFLVTGIGAVAGVVTQIRCTDAAREVARLVAMGDGSASDVGRGMAPGGARISVSTGADVVTVSVSADVPMLPLLSVSARAAAAMEPAGGASGEDS